MRYYNTLCAEMNPDKVHACNPQQNSAWAYYMVHVDKQWLTVII
ncbi:hypothetical protein PSOS111911_17710 [Pseudoalteromonas ostreae]